MLLCPPFTTFHIDDLLDQIASMFRTGAHRMTTKLRRAAPDAEMWRATPYGRHRLWYGFDEDNLEYVVVGFALSSEHVTADIGCGTYGSLNGFRINLEVDDA